MKRIRRQCERARTTPTGFHQAATYTGEKGFRTYRHVRMHSVLPSTEWNVKSGWEIDIDVNIFLNNVSHDRFVRTGVVSRGGNTPVVVRDSRIWYF